jgi:hypothetical protein
MIRALLPGILCLLLALGGCRSDAATAQGVPALLKNPDERTRMTLQRVVSQALGGVAVTLSDEALTDSSLLVIERRRHLDAAGQPIMGRVLEAPDRFVLIRQNGRCLLEHEASGRRWLLEDVSCVSAAGDPAPAG